MLPHACETSAESMFASRFSNSRGLHRKMLGSGTFLGGLALAAATTTSDRSSASPAGWIGAGRCMRPPDGGKARSVLPTQILKSEPDRDRDPHRDRLALRPRGLELPLPDRLQRHVAEPGMAGDHERALDLGF